MTQPPSAGGLPPDVPTLRGWVPVQAAWRDGALQADLLRIGDLRFAEPFFEDTVAKCVRLPFHAFFRQRVAVDGMAAWLAAHPGLPVGGFVFHMSRCGSTLLSQWLAAAVSHRVLSEPPPLDAALQAGAAADEATRQDALRALVGLLAQTTRLAERRLFVKFDSWHARHIPVVARAFPGVPWVFMVRDPVEVLVSHLRQPGAQMVPGLLGDGLPGVDPATAALMPRHDYIARVLGGQCEAALRAFDAGVPGGIVIEHARLREALAATLPRHFALDVDASERAAMVATLCRDAKNPSLDHTDDGAAKRQQASAAVREAAAQWIEPSWRRLLDFAVP